MASALRWRFRRARPCLSSPRSARGRGNSWRRCYTSRRCCTAFDLLRLQSLADFADEMGLAPSRPRVDLSADRRHLHAASGATRRSCAGRHDGPAHLGRGPAGHCDKNLPSGAFRPAGGGQSTLPSAGAGWPWSARDDRNAGGNHDLADRRRGDRLFRRCGLLPLAATAFPLRRLAWLRRGRRGTASGRHDGLSGHRPSDGRRLRHVRKAQTDAARRLRPLAGGSADCASRASFTFVTIPLKVPRKEMAAMDSERGCRS